MGDEDCGGGGDWGKPNRERLAETDEGVLRCGASKEREKGGVTTGRWLDGAVCKRKGYY